MEVILKKSGERFLLILLVTLFFSCNNNRTSSENKVDSLTREHIDSAQNSSQRKQGQEDINHQVIHFWDDIDLLKRYESKELEFIEQHFANYLSLFPNVSEEVIKESLQAFVGKSADDSNLIEHISQLFSKYLYDPNSPFRNDLFYEYALIELIRSNSISSTLKARLEMILELVNRNQQGDIAADFSFLKTDGQQERLSSIKADYTIVVFYVPGCPSCADLINYWNNNSAMHKPVAEGKVKILAIYPDGDKKVWQDYQNSVPKLWVNGVDEKLELLKQRIYDLKSSPTIYILDKDKRVVVKDATIEQFVQLFNLL